MVHENAAEALFSEIETAISSKPGGKTPTGETPSTPFYEVKYDFVLQKAATVQKAA